MIWQPIYFHIILFLIISLNIPADAQSDNLLQKQGGLHAISASASYVNMFFFDNFRFDKIPQGFGFDQVNDTYEAEGTNNWRTGITYSKYFGQKKLFAYNFTAIYASKNAKLIANGRFLAREPESGRLGQLMTVTTINTYFNSVYLQAGLTTFLQMAQNIRFYSTISVYTGTALNNKSAEYSSEIIGFLLPDSDQPIETSITFEKTGTKKFSFRVDDESSLVNKEDRKVFEDAIKGVDYHLGLDIAFGIEYFFTKKIGIQFEVAGTAEFLDYFASQNSGIISKMFITTKICYIL